MAPSVRNAAILIAAALVLVGIMVTLVATNHPSDDVLIKQALTESIEASRKGQAGGVLDLLSKQLKVNQQAAPESSSIAKFIRESRPDITLTNEKPLVTGDEARIVSPMDLKLNFLGQSVSRHLDNVTLVFRREEGRSLLFLPVAKWRLSEVRMPENQVESLSE